MGGNMPEGLALVKGQEHLARIIEERDKVLAEVQELPVTNQAEYEKVVDWITKVRSFLKFAKKLSDDYSKPEKDILLRKAEEVKQATIKAVQTDAELTEKKREWDLKCLKETQEAQKQADLAAQAAFNKQKAKGKTPTLPVPVSDLVEKPTLQVKSDSGTMSTMFVWKWKYANSTASNVVTTKIPRLFHMLDLPKLNKFVKDGVWTKVAEVETGSWLIKECPDIIVYQDVEDRARGGKKEEKSDV